MKWIHGYSAIIFSISSLIPSIIARYSHNHLEEGNYIILKFITNISKQIFPIGETTVKANAIAALPWYKYEDGLILLFQGISLFSAVICIIFVLLSVKKSEKSFFYAAAVLIAAYSIYFVNTKLALFSIFITFIIILTIRKKVGINT